jgi:hypothetical protein
MPHDTDAIRVPLAKTHHVALIDPADAVLAVQHHWYRSGGGYAVTYIRCAGEQQYQVGMHRLLCGLEKGDGLEVDHINLDRLDNRRCNLRVGTRTQNDENRPNGNRGRYSEYRGVTRTQNRWRAYITRGKQINLGLYDHEIDAARAAEAARRVHMPWSPILAELDPVGLCPCSSCRSERGDDPLPGRKFGKALKDSRIST